MYLKRPHFRNCLLYCTVYTGTCICSYYKVKSPCCSGGKSVNRLTASMLGCQIGGFVASKDIQGVSPSMKLRVGDRAFAVAGSRLWKLEQSTT